MDENSFFKLAYENRAAEIASAIRGGSDANAIHSKSGSTPLHVACQAGSLEAIDALVAAGADPNLRYTWRSRVAPTVRERQFALLYAENGDVVRRMASVGANLDAQDSAGYTALAFSIVTANLDMFSALLTLGASCEAFVKEDGRAMSLRELIDWEVKRMVEIAGPVPNATAERAFADLREMQSILDVRAAAR